MKIKIKNLLFLKRRDNFQDTFTTTPETTARHANAWAQTANSDCGVDSTAVEEYRAHILACKVCVPDEDVTAPARPHLNPEPHSCELARQFFARCYPNDKHRYEGLVDDLLGYCVWDGPGSATYRAQPASLNIPNQATEVWLPSEGILNLARAVDRPRQNRVEEVSDACSHAGV
jgi:hypothetical protein